MFRVFCFKDLKRGEIELTGNVLFTHFDEIGKPNKAIMHMDDIHNIPNLHQVPEESNMTPIIPRAQDVSINTPL